MNPIFKLNLVHSVRRIVHKIKFRPKIQSKDCMMGKNVVFGKNVIIRAKYVRIGSGSVIGDNVTIEGDVFELGEYGNIYHNCYFPGGTVRIGHNFWLGAGSIIDGRAITTIGNNVGIGAQSQLWTHMIHGDLMHGCRFHSEKPLTIGNDVWLVGHNLVSPVTIEDQSMAMLGSLITKNMEYNRTYGGVPATDITEKVGAQFKDITLSEKSEIFNNQLKSFAKKIGLSDLNKYVKVIEKADELFTDELISQFNIVNRTYKKCGTTLEYFLVQHMLREVKFIPIN